MKRIDVSDCANYSGLLTASLHAILNTGAAAATRVCVCVCVWLYYVEATML